MREGAVGTGPFRVVRFEPGIQLELEHNPSYWRKGFPACDRLSIHFRLTPDKILSEFRAGRFSLASDLYPADVEALRRDVTLAAGYREKPCLSTYLMALNVHRGPLLSLDPSAVFLEHRVIRFWLNPQLCRRTQKVRQFRE